GDGTYKATVEVQKKYKLEVDGVAGKNTITALRNAINEQISNVKNAVINSAITYLKKELT
ncbi:MAG: peptidoglycan-binding domain-containing protein, partial [Acutalibacteraceae bacterium]|nr:peptidoglycan-binding domain-containing protein [Acutalibacteraceae bacterium]